jgi:hypothetical protein
VLEVSYGSPAGLLADWEQQIKLGGLFAGVEVREELPPFQALTVELCAQGAAPIKVAARLTVATPTTVCVEILPEARDGLAAAVQALCEGVTPSPDRTGAKLEREEARAAPAAVHLTLDRKIATMSVSEKVALALHGNLDERRLLMKDRAGVVQASIARNPRVGLDELTALARSSHLAPDAAEALARHPSHGESATLCAALVRNPRTPVPLAVELVQKLGPTDLRAISKGMAVRAPIQQAARKRLLG